MLETLSINRKEQIADVAAKLFKQKGYTATTMRDLATELGIEAASIYHHIKSKEELLESICFGMADTFINAIHEVNDIYFNAEEKLRMAIKLHVEIITQNQDKSAVFLNEWRSLNPSQLTKFKSMRDQYEQGFRTILNDGEKEDIFDDVDKKFAVLSILSTINFVNEWYNPNGNMNADEIANKLSNFIMGGLRKRLVTDR